MANLLALDQSSHTTGYSIFQDGKLLLVSHIDINDIDLGDRLEKLRNFIIVLIKKYKIDEVAFEDIQLQDVNGNKETGIKTFKVLAEVFGVVHELVNELNLKYNVVMPIKWKAHFKIAGKGRTQEKKMAQKIILEKYNIKCSEDEADSICIGLYQIAQNNSFDWSD